VLNPRQNKLFSRNQIATNHVVHLWAPWCSNCQAELKTGGWTKIINENPQVKFYFVSIWNDGQDGRAMLNKFGIAAQPNVTILADPGPRRGENKIKQLAGLPLSLDSDDLDLQRRRSPLRIELRRGSLSCAPTVSDRQPVGMVAQRRAID
jgi:hypothetical protein